MNSLGCFWGDKRRFSLWRNRRWFAPFENGAQGMRYEPPPAVRTKFAFIDDVRDHDRGPRRQNRCPVSCIEAKDAFEFCPVALHGGEPEVGDEVAGGALTAGFAPAIEVRHGFDPVHLLVADRENAVVNIKRVCVSSPIVIDLI